MNPTPKALCPNCGLLYNNGPRGWRNHANSAEHYALTTGPNGKAPGLEGYREVAKHVAEHGLILAWCDYCGSRGPEGSECEVCGSERLSMFV